MGARFVSSVGGFLVVGGRFVGCVRPMVWLWGFWDFEHVPFAHGVVVGDLAGRGVCGDDEPATTEA
ncbi:hypothetical protein FRC0514_01199 [Corynebacterium diphtheriae]|nr:hypothetical protein FRC0469_01066 [Corynebacterium diphtheriae]CAB0992753.1 hypothetical protein FRC0514_01199 [Corynebacterium diphtheriae]